MKKWIILILAVISSGLVFWSCSDDKSTEPDPEPDPYLTVSAPNGGEVWQIDSTKSITWNDNITAKVKIELYRSGALEVVIADSVPSSGEYIWILPDTLTVCPDYKIRITSVTNSAVTDSSDADFSVTEVFSPGAEVFVQGDVFAMGNHFSSDEGDTDEIPNHTVTLSDFYIGKYEITQSEWAAYMPASEYNSGSGENYPVYNVSWYSIIKYCNLRSIAEDLTPCYSIGGTTDTSAWGAVPTAQNTVWDSAICNWSADGYRLPTEAEWEYAARGGSNWNDNYHYSGSNSLDDFAWFEANSDSSSHVGTKLPNQLGIYDMSGNVWEWCWDWYGVYLSTLQNNPYGAASGSERVNRGGSWVVSELDDCRVSNRNKNNPALGYSYVGFRIARTP